MKTPYATADLTIQPGTNSKMIVYSYHIIQVSSRSGEKRVITYYIRSGRCLINT